MRIAVRLILGVAVIGLTACGSVPLSTSVVNVKQAPAPAYAQAKCSSLHRILLTVERDAQQQERTITSNTAHTASAIAKAWLPPDSYGKDLQALAAAVKPYGNARGSEVSRITSQAAAVNKELNGWLSGTKPGGTGHLPDNWQADFSRFQTGTWKLAADCGIARGTQWGVALNAAPSRSASASPSASPSPSLSPSSNPPSPSPTSPAPTSPAYTQSSTPSPWCTATASVYDASSNENNIYVRSNQPYTDAIANADGYSWSYETNGSGYALIFLNGPAEGADVTVTVGGATCTATWN